MVRRLFPILALALFVVVPAEAKRRAVRSGWGPPPAGNCHTFAFVRPGLKASYATESASGTATFTITHVSDSANLAVVTQKVQTPQGEADAETRIDMEMVGSLRATRHMNIKTSMNVPFVGKVTTETDIDFVPSLPYGPAQGWCVGATWTIPPTTQTVVTKSSAGALPPTVVTTLAGSGEVLAVGEVITVPAGTFNTVKYRGATVTGTSVQPVIAWMSMQHGVLVRQDSLDAAGNVTSITRLTAVQ